MENHSNLRLILHLARKGQYALQRYVAPRMGASEEAAACGARGAPRVANADGIIGERGRSR